MRRVIGRIIAGEYVNLENIDVDGAPTRGPLYGPDSKDYFRGARPSKLGELDNRQLYSVANRLYTLLEEGRGTKEELAHAHDAYSTVIREARSRRATLHD